MIARLAPPSGRGLVAPLLAAAALLGASAAAAADAPGRLLETGRWEMISPPADVGATPMAEVFAHGGVLTADGYEDDWIAYRTVAPTGPGGPGYEVVPPDAPFETGRGYWVIQVTGEDVTVTLPAGAAPAAKRRRGCPSVAACVTAPLEMAGDGRRYLWNLTGLPVTETTPLADATVLADEGPCAGGCDFAEAKAADVMNDEMWRYVDRPGTAYERVTTSSALDPWDATWVLALAGPDGPAPNARWAVGEPVPDQRPDLADYVLAFEDDFEGVEVAGSSRRTVDPEKWNTGHLWGPYSIINQERQLYVDTQRVHAGDPDAYDPFVFGTDAAGDTTMKIVASKLARQYRQVNPPGTLPLECVPTDGSEVPGGAAMPVKPAPPPPVNPDPDAPPPPKTVWDYLDYQHRPDYSRESACTNYLSGILTSYESFRFAHGYAEIRAKLPAGKGLWPAFWLFRSEYVHDFPELDVMEFHGDKPNEVYHTYHFTDRSDPAKWRDRRTPTYETVGPDFTADFHTYGVAWEPGQVIWYVDGMETRRVRQDELATAEAPGEPPNPLQLPNQAMFLLVNLAVGGSWPGTPPPDADYFPAEYELDYVRVWERKTAVPVDLDDYEMAFHDEFDRTTLKEPDGTSKWNTAFIWGPHLPINCELQYYVDALGTDAGEGRYSPFSLDGDHLTITAAATGTQANVPTPLPDPIPDTLAANRADKISACLRTPFWRDRPDEFSPGTSYTSGILTSYDAFQFVDGYAEIRAKVPSGDGLWPAFWLLNGYYRHETPEIDVMEIVGEQPGRVHHAFHRAEWADPAARNGVLSRKFTHDGGDPVDGFSDDFHTYAVQWKARTKDEPGLIVWYVDGVETARYAGEDVPEQLMYVIVNLAVGGNFNTVDVDDAALPAELVIDYIRVYQGKRTP